MEQTPQFYTLFFCTYKNSTTNGWQKSREYESITELQTAMIPYLEQHPRTTVQYQTTRKQLLS